MQKQPTETIVEWSSLTQNLQQEVNLWKRRKRTLVETGNDSDSDSGTTWQLGPMTWIRYEDASKRVAVEKRVKLERKSTKSIQQISVTQGLESIFFTIRKSLGGVENGVGYKSLPRRWFLYDKGGEPFHSTKLQVSAAYDSIKGNIKHVRSHLDILYPDGSQSFLNPIADVSYKPDFNHFVATSHLHSNPCVPTLSRDAGAYFLLRPFRIPDSDSVRVLLTQVELPYPFVDGDVKTARPKEVILTDQLPVSLTVDSIRLKFREILEIFFTHSDVIL